MKKPVKKVTAASIVAGTVAAVASLSLPGCPKGGSVPKPVFDPSDNEPEDVYGPPPFDYEPEDNIPVAVYGPPEWFEDGTAQRVINGESS